MCVSFVCLLIGWMDWRDGLERWIGEMDWRDGLERWRDGWRDGWRVRRSAEEKSGKSHKTNNI